MRRWLQLAALLLGAVVVGVMWSRRETPVMARSPAATVAMEEVRQVPPETGTGPDTSPGPADALTPATAAGSGAATAPTGRRAIAAAAQPPAGPEVAPGLTPVVVLENMRSAFHQYSARFGGNPVGVNREITAALNGANPKQVVFINPDDGLRINDQGELIDNWGTPFFFHQLSGTEMEIRSAGPDRRMWTPDDLVIK